MCAFKAELHAKKLLPLLLRHYDRSREDSFYREGAEWGVLVYYSAGVAGLAAFGAAQALPHEGPLWLAARLLLDGSGCLFGLYLLTVVALTLAGHVMRFGRNRAELGTRRGK